jgi:hypothetical protein
MKQNRSIFAPAIAVAIISILLIAYYFYAASHETNPQPPQGNFFTTLGTFAVISGAISFSWFRFKKKLKSPSLFIKKLAKIFYVAHTYAGWIALVLIGVHGGYFLITRLNDSNILSGLAAFFLNLTLAIYGWFIKRKPNKFMRKTHFLLSILWLLVLIVHAGGTFIAIAIITLMVWGIIWIVEKRAKPSVIKEI